MIMSDMNHILNQISQGEHMAVYNPFFLEESKGLPEARYVFSHIRKPPGHGEIKEKPGVALNHLFRESSDPHRESGLSPHLQKIHSDSFDDRYGLGIGLC